MWHAYEDVFYGFLLNCVAFVVAIVVCSFFFLHVFTLRLIIPQFVQYLSIFLVLLFIFCGAAYLIFCGTESALLASTINMPSSHNITTSLCCCSVDLFIPIVTILRYDCKPALNTIVKKLYVVSICKPWTNFWILS